MHFLNEMNAIDFVLVIIIKAASGVNEKITEVVVK